MIHKGNGNRSFIKIYKGMAEIDMRETSIPSN